MRFSYSFEDEVLRGVVSCKNLGTGVVDVMGGLYRGDAVLGRP